LLEGVDVVEGEKGVAVQSAFHAAVILPHYKKSCPLLRFPSKVFDERLATYQQFERINQQGKLRQNYVVLRHTKAVQISRFGCGD
jgi:hypothetical protein